MTCALRVVFDLSTDKERVLAEAYRILRPGGRLQIADMVKDPSACEGVCCSGDESWADCVVGTLAPNTFLSMLSKAGFIDVENWLVLRIIKQRPVQQEHYSG